MVRHFLPTGTAGRYRAALAAVAAAVAPAAAIAEPAVATLNASASYNYASNLFFLSPREQRTSNFASVDDNFFLPEVGAHLSAPVGRQLFELKATGSYRFYKLNTKIDSFDYDIQARMAFALESVCTGVLLAEQEDRQTDYADANVSRPINVRDRTAQANITCAITPEIGVATSFEYRSEANSDAILAAYDLDRTTVYSEINHGLVETGQAFAAVRYRARKQPLFITEPTPNGLTGVIWDVGGGARWSPSEDVEIVGQGYWSQLRETSHARDSTGFSGDLKAAWSYSPKTKFTLAADTGLDVSTNIGAIAFRASTASIEVNWLATPKIEANVQAGYTIRGILRDFAPGQLEIVTRHEHDETLTLSGSVNYRLSDRLVARVAAGYRDRRGNFEDITFRATTASIGVTYRFDGPPIDAPAL